MPPPTNIAIIAGQLVVGGAEKQLYLWLANLDRESFNPIVLTLHPGYGDYWEKPVEDLGIPLFRINHRKNRFSRLREIRRTLQPFQPQLVHGWHLFSGAYASLVAPRFKAKSLVGIRSSFESIQNSLELRIAECFADDLPYTQACTGITPAHRATAVDSMLAAALHLGLNNDSLFTGVAVLDRFLAAKPVLLPLLQPTAIACLWVAAKYEQQLVPPVRDFANMVVQVRQMVGVGEGGLVRWFQHAVRVTLMRRCAGPFSSSTCAARLCLWVAAKYEQQLVPPVRDFASMVVQVR